MPIALLFGSPRERERVQARTHGTARKTHKSARRTVSRLMNMCRFIMIQTSNKGFHSLIPPKDRMIPEMKRVQSSIIIGAAMSAAGKIMVEQDIDARCVLTTICAMLATIPVQYHNNILMSTKCNTLRGRVGMKRPELSL